MTKTKLPNAADQISRQHPEVWEAFERFGEACTNAGPIDSRARHLVKIAVAIAARSEGATHSNVRRALADGVPAEEIRHVSLLLAPTLGLAQAVAGRTWIEDILNRKPS